MSEHRVVCKDCRPEDSNRHRIWTEWCRPCAEVTASRHRSNYPGHRVSISSVGVSEMASKTVQQLTGGRGW